jgi:hypothetical protein
VKKYPYSKNLIERKVKKKRHVNQFLINKILNDEIKKK